MKKLGSIVVLLLLSVLSNVLLFSIPVWASQEELDEIRDAIKAKGAHWVADETSVSKLPPEERRVLLGTQKPILTGFEALSPRGLTGLTTAAPPSFDWRNSTGNTFVTPVRDQGGCGSCWAFATTAALESYVLITQNTPGTDVNLSEQTLVSCPGPATGNCGGGSVGAASTYIKNTGLPVEACFPYTATNNSCTNACSTYRTNTYRIYDWYYVATYAPTVSAIKNALYTYGPLVTTMDVYADFFNYRTGVYTYVSGSYQGGHAILIVGYNDGGGYFIVKNSWGTGWGESGYFRIAYSQLTNVVEFGWYTIAYEAPPQTSVNLTPDQPAGWSDKIVVSKVTGTTTDSSPLYTTDTLYVDWAVINNGPAATSASFTAGLYVDEGLRQTWNIPSPLNPAAWTSIYDYSIGSLGAGVHTIRIVVDSTGVINESNEGDNEYTKTITIQSATFSYTVNTNPSGLQVTIDGFAYTSPYTFTWTSGTVHTIGSSSPQLSPDGRTRYVFSSWSDGGLQIHQVPVPPSNTTYVASFATQYILGAAVNPPGNGSVTLTPSGPWINAGQAVQLTATPNSGYSFSGWSGDLAGVVNPASVTMNGPKAVTANFTQNQYTLAAAGNPSCSGSIIKTPDKVTYVYGDTVQLKATATPGYAFSSWGGNASGSANPVPIVINGNKTVTANFTAGTSPPPGQGQWKIRFLTETGDTITTSDKAMGYYFINGEDATLTIVLQDPLNFVSTCPDIGILDVPGANCTLLGNGSVTAKAGQTFSFVVGSSTSGATLSVRDLPTNASGIQATFNPGTGIFQWSTNLNDVGTYLVVFQAAVTNPSTVVSQFVVSINITP